MVPGTTAGRNPRSSWLATSVARAGARPSSPLRSAARPRLPSASRTPSSVPPEVTARCSAACSAPAAARASSVASPRGCDEDLEPAAGQICGEPRRAERAGQRGLAPKLPASGMAVPARRKSVPASSRRASTGAVSRAVRSPEPLDRKPERGGESQHLGAPQRSLPLERGRTRARLEREVRLHGVVARHRAVGPPERHAARGTRAVPVSSARTSSRPRRSAGTPIRPAKSARSYRGTAAREGERRSPERPRHRSRVARTVEPNPPAARLPGRARGHRGSRPNPRAAPRGRSR